MTAVNRFLGGMTSSFFLTGTSWSGLEGLGAGARPARSVGWGAPRSYNLATWVNESSTGVSRPKIETRTCSFCCSALISLIVAGRVANGPSMTVTDSPTSKSTTAVVVLAAAGPPAAAAPGGFAPWGAIARGGGLTAPSAGNGGGVGGAPAKPLTPG